MKKSMSMVIGAAMLAALLVGCQNSKDGEDASAAAQVESEVVTQEQAQQINTVEAWGTVDAETIQEVRVDFNAMVTAVHVQEGQEVNQGDKLATLDYSDYKNSILQKEKEVALDKQGLEAQIKSAGVNTEKINNLQIKVNNIKTRMNEGTDNDIVLLENDIKANQADLEALEKDIKAQKELLEVGSSTQKTIDDLEKQASDLKSKIGAAQQKIANTKKDKEAEIRDLNSQISEIKKTMSETEKDNQETLTSIGMKQEIADIEIERMKAKYNKDYLQGDDIVLNIPHGIIKSVKAVEGAQLGDANNCIFEIIDQDSLIVKANVAEEFIKDVKVGAEVNIIPYADREAVFKGKVKSIENMAVDNNGETVIPIIVEATEASPYLRYGYSVDIEIMAE